jgi:hypothetical protein
MILQIVYRLIILFLVIVIGYDVFEEESKMMKLTAALILIPFLLRLLMIK